MSNNKKSSLDKDFVPYEEALALKKLAFDEPCLAYYNKKELFSFAQVCNEPIKGHYIKISVMLCTPTFSQAFRWFREKHNLPSHIHTIWQHDWNNYSYRWHITKDKNQWPGIKHFETYEEVELECLKELIEIAKQRGNK